jgi:hypothetical protein
MSACRPQVANAWGRWAPTERWWVPAFISTSDVKEPIPETTRPPRALGRRGSWSSRLGYEIRRRLRGTRATGSTIDRTS